MWLWCLPFLFGTTYKPEGEHRYSWEVTPKHKLPNEHFELVSCFRTSFKKETSTEQQVPTPPPHVVTCVSIFLLISCLLYPTLHLHVFRIISLFQVFWNLTILFQDFPSIHCIEHIFEYELHITEKKFCRFLLFFLYNLLLSSLSGTCSLDNHFIPILMIYSAILLFYFRGISLIYFPIHLFNTNFCYFLITRIRFCSLF